MTYSHTDNLYCDGYHFFFQGWILHLGIPSWKFQKKIILTSKNNTIQIIPDLELRPDVSKAFIDPSLNTFINYDHSGFILKVLKQNLPNDYFNIKLEIKSNDLTDSVVLKQMIYI